MITGEKNGVEGLVIAINRWNGQAWPIAIRNNNGALKREYILYDGAPASIDDASVIALCKYTIEAHGSNSPGQYYNVLSTNYNISTQEQLAAYLEEVYETAFGVPFEP